MREASATLKELDKGKHDSAQLVRKARLTMVRGEVRTSQVGRHDCLQYLTKEGAITSVRKLRSANQLLKEGRKEGTAQLMRRA